VYKEPKQKRQKRGRIKYTLKMHLSREKKKDNIEKWI